MAEERKRQEQEAERRQEEARRRRQQIEAQRRQREDIVQPVERTGSARARVFRDRKQLRQAIVLKEVLDRPRGIKELDDFSWT